MIAPWVLGISILLWGPPFADLSPKGWPPVRPGVWELREEWSAKNGKPQVGTYQMNQCLDQWGMFMGLLTEGILELAGCHYDSTRITPTIFRITGDCAIRGLGIARTESIVNMESETSFRIDMRDYGRSKEKRLRTIGHWVSGCGEENK